MKRRVLWFWLTVFSVTAAFSAGQAQLPEGDGKPLLEGICAVCHTLDRITSKQYDQESWEGIVQSMKDKGADLTEKETAILVEYLAKHFGKPGQPQK
jgi:hypothetical protein